MEKSAFEQKARTWREKALKVSMHYGAGKDEAEDIAQDVMLRLWQMHDELERFRSVEAIVALMARHQLRNHQRRKPLEALDEAMIVSLTTSPQEMLEMKEDDQWLSAKLQQLPTTQRTLLYMRQVERRSHEEIANLLGIETTSVSTLLARARRTLLEEIKRRNQI
jgi:RNA polymerase sigma-70 factor (ECF subfamily)